MYMFNKNWLVNKLCPVAYLIYSFSVHLDIILIPVLAFTQVCMVEFAIV
jgi:hypothetical protein